MAELEDELIEVILALREQLSHENPQLSVRHWQYLESLMKYGRHDRVPAACDVMVERYADRSDLDTRVLVAHSFRLKAEAFEALEQYDAAIATYGELARRYGDDTAVAVRNAAARALLFQGLLYQKQGRMEEALQAVDELLRRYGADADATMRQDVVPALRLRSEVLARLEQFDEAIASLESVEPRCQPEETAWLRSQPPAAMLSKAVLLKQLGRTVEGIDVCRQIIQRYAGDPEPSIRELVAMAWQNTMDGLYQLDRYAEALATSEAAAAWFKAPPPQPPEPDDPSLEIYAANVLTDRAYTLYALALYDEAIDAAEELRRRFEPIDTPEAVLITARALSIRGNAEISLGRIDTALETFTALDRLAGPMAPVGVIALVIEGAVSRAFVLDERDQAEAAIADLLQMVHRYAPARSGTLLSMARRPRAGEAAPPPVAVSAGMSRERAEAGPASAIDPKLLVPLGRVAATLVHLGASEDGLRVAEQVLRLAGRSAVATHRTARIWAQWSRGAALLNLSRFQEALRCYDELLEREEDVTAPDLKPVMARALLNKGFALVGMLRLDEARWVMEEVIRRYEGEAGFRTEELLTQARSVLTQLG